MKLFDFFKGEKKEKPTRDKYWSLTTNDDEIINPTIEQIEQAVQNATPKVSLFATLVYNHSGLEIETVQTLSTEGVYRFEALTSDGKIYVKNDIAYEETLELFHQFYNYQRVPGFRRWPIEKY